MWFCCLLGWQVGHSLTVVNLFSDHMVIQRDMSVPIWGTATAGSTVKIVYKGRTDSAVADNKGRWECRISPLSELAPFDIKISGDGESILISDVIPGDVYLCSGQSNMEMKFLWSDHPYKNEKFEANNDLIRYIDVANTLAANPQDTLVLASKWQQMSAENFEQCSEVAYFFAKKIQGRYGVPVGLILSEWGGTAAEVWIRYGALSAFPEMQKQADIFAEATPLTVQEAEAAVKLWNEQFAAQDIQNSAWHQPDFDDSDWKIIKAPQVWEDQGFLGLDGVVIYRKTIDLPESATNHNLTISLAMIDDEDIAYFNGVEIGRGNVWNVLRTYTIPRSLVRKGRNVISIRVLDTGGGGGIHGNSGLLALSVPDGSNAMNLSGDWKVKVSVDFANLPPRPKSGSWPTAPSVLYNAMIAPLVKFPVRCVLWYQGESNASQANVYRELLPTLIRDWRNEFAIDFPFLVVQLAAYKPAPVEPSESEWAELREAQAMATALPNVGLACAIDLGEANDIHPKNKKDVGERLALHAMQMVYGEQVETSGPVYKSSKVKGNRVVIEFTHAGKKLVAKDGAVLRQFAIAGPDKHWVWATAEIRGDKIEVWSDQVAAPVAVRYAWADNPEGCNLYNAEGLPAVPFRTDDWPTK